LGIKFLGPTYSEDVKALEGRKYQVQRVCTITSFLPLLHLHAARNQITDSTQPGYPLLGNLLDLAPSKGNLVPLFATWAKQYGPIMQFKVFGITQVVVSDEAMVHELFVKRAAKYSGRGVPYAIEHITGGMTLALMPKNGMTPPSSPF
jgi:hypothetical protein